MSYLVIRLGTKNIKITAANYAGNKVIIEKFRVFDLPEELALESHSIAHSDKVQAMLPVFITECINNGGFKKGKTIILLDDSMVVMKEFAHTKLTPAELSNLSLFEAESLLPGAVSDYVIKTGSYSDRENIDGKVKSILYAARQKYLEELYGALIKTGLKIVKIGPYLDSYISVLQRALQCKNMPEGCKKTMAAIDFRASKTEVVCFSEGKIVSAFSLNSVMGNLDLVISQNLSLSVQQAREYIERNGFNENSTENLKNESLYAESKKIIISNIEYVLRNIRIALSSERLQLDQIIISGDYSVIPGIAEKIEDIVGCPCAPISKLQTEANKLIVTKDSSVKFDQIVAIAGAGLNLGKKNLNLTPASATKKRRSVENIIVFTVITALVALLMAAEPLLYMQAINTKNINEKILSQPLYKAVIDKRNQIDVIKSEITKKNDPNYNGLPDTGSTSDIIAKFRSVVGARVEIGQLAYNRLSGTISADLLGAGFTEINEARNNINVSGIFTTTDNSKIIQDSSGRLAYRVEVTIKKNS